MNINEKIHRKKSPEDIAHQATEAHYFLFYDKDMDYVLKHEKTQDDIEKELAAIAIMKKYEEDAVKATKSYVY